VICRVHDRKAVERALRPPGTNMRAVFMGMFGEVCSDKFYELRRIAYRPCGSHSPNREVVLRLKIGKSEHLYTT
jgi:hypothetical protein